MSESRLNIKQVLLTAVITCVFAVVAGVGTYILTTKEAELTYSLSSGPALSAEGIHKKIFLIEINNSGRKEVSDVIASVKVANGNIVEASREMALGIQATENRTQNEYSLNCKSLNPKEKVSISILAEVPTPEYTPIFSVRGKGVTGEEKYQSSKVKSPLAFLLAGVVAGLLGFITSANPFIRKILKFTPVPLFARAFFRSGSMVGPFERNELVAYILGVCSLKEQSDRIRFSPSEISYRGATDYLANEAVAASPNERSKFMSALKCFLLIKKINPASLDVIKSTLKLLVQVNDAEIDKIQKQAVHEDVDPVKLRNRIANLADESKQSRNVTNNSN